MLFGKKHEGEAEEKNGYRLSYIKVPRIGLCNNTCSLNVMVKFGG
jgi:hypothetical protein